MTLISRKVTSRTPDYTRRTYDYAIRTKPRNLGLNHVIEIDQWESRTVATNIRASGHLNQLIRGLTSLNTLTSSGFTKLDSSWRTCGSGKFVNQNKLVADYYSSKAGLTELSKVLPITKKWLWCYCLIIWVTLSYSLSRCDNKNCELTLDNYNKTCAFEIYYKPLLLTPDVCSNLCHVL